MPVPHPEPDFWRARRVLVTGHTGFKGSWIALWLHQLGAKVTGIALRPCDQSLFRLLRLDGQVSSHFIDLRDAAAIAAAVEDTQPELVLHLTAQTSVHRSVLEPAESFAINVLGTVNLLNALRTIPTLRSVLVVTTDKVYADDHDGRAHAEQDRLGGRDPYSASKAACELATTAMAQSFLAPQGVAVATARAGNVIGGGDFSPGRLVPDAVNAALSGQTLTLRNPDASRPWQHVLDCLCGYLTYLAALTIDPTLPRTMNFGPRSPQGPSVGEIASAMLEALGAHQGCDYVPSPQVVETHALALDSTLARRTLGWSDRLPGRLMIDATAAWYRAWAQGADMRTVTSRQITGYETLS
ncbi:MAG TPA: CDP-glucose 4,6-dehydratase [Acetobacteraceae bacterium]|nr:CDP-glucose 4,6-dehydratase [Acetobacteraceae bacterium]